MRRPRLLWQLYAPLLAIVVVALVCVAALTAQALKQFYLDNKLTELTAQSKLVARLLAQERWTGREGDIAREIERLGQTTGARVTLILAGGTVIADSAAAPTTMDNHARRPEIVAALASGTGSSMRFSDTVRENMMYVAVPVTSRDRVGGVVRTAMPLTAIEQALRAVNLRIAFGGLVIAIVAAATIWLVSRRISRPLEELERAAATFARGELGARLPISGSGEMASLAEAMNRMAAELDDRIRAVVRQRNEQEAVLSSMVEGVIAVDAQERVMTLNAAAAHLLGNGPDQAVGRSIEEVARNSELQRFVGEALASETVIEGDLTLHGREVRYLQAHGSPIRDAQGRRVGSVLVLNDVTRLRRLETMRRDFVANVSHELRTPITSIKGFLETLCDGAIDRPEDAKRFLTIASRQADRLNAIIEDLLRLARIEEEAESAGLPKTNERVRDVLQGALDVCRKQAENKGVALHLTCDVDLEAHVNAALLEQAIVNLVDNAINYSEAGSAVEVDARLVDGRLVIRVRDEGRGIEATHLPRLFERFYRVDKARSRSLGGTGLGLAIVKHIAGAHGGSVDVASAPGKGSTFTLVLPAEPESNTVLTNR